ncbi:toxin RelE [Xenorhabdus sp. KJ12.1]|nr:toxin RelE [Xenorhabdus sp. KJ12.1]
MWTVILTDCFYFWLAEQDGDTQEKVLASLGNLERYGPRLSRPYADTIKGSKYPNMKELRVQHTGKPIRAFFAFDPKRQAIVLCAGDKSNDKKFYQKMIRIADDEFTTYLASMEDKL